VYPCGHQDRNYYNDNPSIDKFIYIYDIQFWLASETRPVCPCSYPLARVIQTIQQGRLEKSPAIPEPTGIDINILDQGMHP
jgi:hypothetical protein